MYLSSDDKVNNDNFCSNQLLLYNSIIFTFSQRLCIPTVIMNRLPTLDPHVLTIADLKEAACHDMPKMYRGKINRLGWR